MTGGKRFLFIFFLYSPITLATVSPDLPANDLLNRDLADPCRSWIKRSPSVGRVTLRISPGDPVDFAA